MGAAEFIRQGRDKQLVAMLNRAFDALENDCRCGVYICKKQIPKYYMKKYGELPNLWKYNLSDSGRLVYFITSSGGEARSFGLRRDLRVRVISHPKN